MANFPVLSTGAVTQYPAACASGRLGQAIRFLDGSGQRFIARGPMLRRWLISLALLNELELSQIEQFFQDVGGEYTTFAFPDPFSGTSVSNCRLGGPGLVTDYEGVDVGSTSFWVIETNG
jgi:hypothetical protein